MKPATFDLALGLKKTRKREFLRQMEEVLPSRALVEFIAPYYPARAGMLVTFWEGRACMTVEDPSPSSVGCQCAQMSSQTNQWE